MSAQWPETGAGFLYEPYGVETDREMSAQASDTDRTWLKSSDRADRKMLPCVLLGGACLSS